MQTKQIIHTVSCHAEGEVGDVIIGGVPVPPGETLISENLSLAQIQSQFAKDEKALVEIVYNEVVAGSFGGFRLEVV